MKCMLSKPICSVAIERDVYSKAVAIPNWSASICTCILIFMGRFCTSKNGNMRPKGTPCRQAAGRVRSCGQRLIQLVQLPLAGSINQSNKQIIKQLVSQSINQSVSQSINKSINQPTNQSSVPENRLKGVMTQACNSFNFFDRLGLPERLIRLMTTFCSSRSQISFTDSMLSFVLLRLYTVS